MTRTIFAVDDLADLLRILAGPEPDPFLVAIQPVTAADLLGGGLLSDRRWFTPAVPAPGGA